MKHSSLNIQPIAQSLYQLNYPLIQIHFCSVTRICVYNIQMTTKTKDARSPTKIHLENMYTPIYNRPFHYCCTKYLTCRQFWTSSTLVSSKSPVKLYMCIDENTKLPYSQTPFAHLLHCSWRALRSLLVEHSRFSAATASCSWLFSFIWISRAATVTQKPGGITADNCNNNNMTLYRSFEYVLTCITYLYN